MKDRELYLGMLRVAEQQFRLACTVHLAVFNGVQTLDTPKVWNFGQHSVQHEDFGLRPDQADIAAFQLELTSTFVMASTIRDVLVGLFSNLKTHPNADVAAAYQITRMLRNAFSHSMIHPTWSIDADCRDRTFSIDGIISLDTSSLNGRALNWRDYGGPLSIFYLGRFVREKLIGDFIAPDRKKPSEPTIECYQQGRLVLRRVEKN